MIHNIQTLRFAAAMAVVFHHTQAYVVAAGFHGPHLFSSFGQFGYFGVDVFFVISGFIIWHTSKDIEGGRWGLDFAYRRAARIYTGYWPYFLIALGIAFALTPELLEQKDLLSSFWLNRIPIPQLLIPVSWTLSYELYFYFIFTMLIMFPMRYRLPMILLLLAAVFCIQAYAQLVLGGYRKETFGEVSMLYRYYASPYLIEFISGSLLAVYYRKLSIPAILLFGCFLLLLWAGILYQNTLPELTLSRGYYNPQRVALFGSAAFFLVWAVVSLELKGFTPIPKASLFLGAISYSLYLSHTIILQLLQQLGVQQMISQLGHANLWYLLIILIITAYSAAHYIWIETPLGHLFRRFRAAYMKIDNKIES